MWPALIPVIGNLLEKFIPDPKQAADAKLKMLEMAQKGELAVLDADMRLALGQIDINKEEAKSDNLFKSGWRPAVGWTCVAGLAYEFLFRTIFGWALKLHAFFGGFTAEQLASFPTPPSLDMGTLITLLGGLLGLGTLRTIEKVRGSA